MHQGSSIVTIVIGFVAAFVLLWCAVLWLVAWACGWRRLAGRFASSVPFQGAITSFATASIRFANYSGVLNLGVSDWGLYLVPMKLFRPFHPPLLIPWTEVEATLSERSAWYRQGVRLTFPSAPRASIIFYGRAVDHDYPGSGDRLLF